MHRASISHNDMSRILGAKELGALGESLAADYLRDHGYRILERNWRWRRGEIDLVTAKDGEVVFVEVKARRSHRYGTPEESITYAKRTKLIQSAYAYLDSNDNRDARWRIDVVAIDFDGEGIVIRLEHIVSAVEGE